MTRVLPMRRVNSAWPRTLLILCDPVWVRSSRLSRMRAPPAAVRRFVVSVTGVGRPAYDVSRRSSSAWKAGSAFAFVHSASSWSSAATSASGTNRPPYGPKWPDASGTVSAVMGRARGGGGGAGGEHGRDGLPRVGLGPYPLADEDRVGAGPRVRDEVVRLP